ncbi:MAG: porphobilinogen synthase [Methanoregulaceae archaeon]|nr:porphobilinogen synthase [Methanoregulaceae archaeon]
MFPQQRMRRLRGRLIQPYVREHHLRKSDLVMPFFIDETAESPTPIATMPGQFRYPLGSIAPAVLQVQEKGIGAVLLFGIPARKDAEASESYNPEGVIQEAVRRIKAAAPKVLVITDVCACEYTDHGHCGILGEGPCGMDLQNDLSLELMARIAVSHAQAGADFVAPSCMLDGMVAVIREALDFEGFQDTGIISYSTKFASALYGPFREAADSGYQSGDRSTYQIHPGNSREAIRESETDALEGADILMVKPGGFYLDLVASVRALGLPVAVYQVSGEYAMIKAAAMNGWIDEKNVVMESLICAKRAGADLIITYYAADAAGWLDEEQ